MSRPIPAGDKKPQHVKRFTLALLILGLLMLGTQVMNLIVTFLPGTQEAMIQLDDGTILTVDTLRSSYLTLVIFVLIIFGGTWFFLQRSAAWARWVAVILAILAGLGGVQGVFQAWATGTTQLLGPTLSLAQLVAAGWVLALAFRHDVHGWFHPRSH